MSLIVRDVVAVVSERRGIKRQQPDRVDAEILDVIELLNQPLEVADAVVVRIEERSDVQLVDDGVLVPVRIGRDGNVQAHAGLGRWTSKMCAGSCGIEPHVIPRPVPGVRAIGQQVTTRRRCRCPATDVVRQRQADPSLARRVRIERDDHQELAWVVGRRLAVGNQRLARREVEAQPVVVLQCGLRLADVVDLRDQAVQVARRCPVAVAESGISPSRDTPRSPVPPARFSHNSKPL